MKITNTLYQVNSVMLRSNMKSYTPATNKQDEFTPSFNAQRQSRRILAKALQYIDMMQAYFLKRGEGVYISSQRR